MASSSSVVSATGTRAAVGSASWIVAPWFDLLFVVNILWPLAFLPGYISMEGTPYIEFWQIHFVATPHRWMTLFLVAMDPDRRAGRSWVFIGIAVAVACVLGGVQWATGSLAVLGTAYYTWNGWHFASQHSGILRIYSLKSGGGSRWLDTYGMRTLVAYGAIRLIPGFDAFVEYAGLDVQLLDWLVLFIPAFMFASEASKFSVKRLPKLVYQTSVSVLYVSHILAAHYQMRLLILALVTAGTLFHAIEYFAIVSHYAMRRRTVGSAGIFQKVARHWLLVFAWFLIACGIIFSTADRLFASTFLLVNMWASYLHFAYDGLIWKLRQPSTAKALDAGSPP